MAELPLGMDRETYLARVRSGGTPLTAFVFDKLNDRDPDLVTQWIHEFDELMKAFLDIPPHVRQLVEDIANQRGVSLDDAVAEIREQLLPGEEGP